jgi:bacterioferritin-associated ferredoxin
MPTPTLRLSKLALLAPYQSSPSSKMLICHCNAIAETEIEQAILEMLEEDAWQPIMPAKVYHRMQKRGRCCGCFANVVETIIRVTEDYPFSHRVDDVAATSRKR